LRRPTPPQSYRGSGSNSKKELGKLLEREFAMTMARRFITLIIAGAAVAFAPNVATAASQLAGSYSSPLIGATVVGTVGNKTAVVVVQGSKINGADVGSIGNGTSQTIIQKGASNYSLEISIGTGLRISP
jgi:hypothetical protein